MDSSMDILDMDVAEVTSTMDLTLMVPIIPGMSQQFIQVQFIKLVLIQAGGISGFNHQMGTTLFTRKDLVVVISLSMKGNRFRRVHQLLGLPVRILTLELARRPFQLPTITVTTMMELGLIQLRPSRRGQPVVGQMEMAAVLFLLKNTTSNLSSCKMITPSKNGVSILAQTWSMKDLLIPRQCVNML